MGWIKDLLLGREVSLDERAGRMLYATDGRDILHNAPDGWEVERPGLWWEGAGGDEGTISGPWGNPPPGARNGFYGIDCLPAVTRCTSLISDTLASLPWQTYRGDEKQPDLGWLADPQQLRRDNRVVGDSLLPDDRLSTVEYWSNWITSALWWGDGYLFVPQRDTTGMPKAPLWQLHPAKVKLENREGFWIDADNTGSEVATAGYGYWVEDVRIPDDMIIHLRGSTPYWNGHGNGVLTRHGRELGLAMSVATYAGGVFSAGVPAGYLKVSRPTLTPDQAAALKSTWMKNHGSRRSIAVLDATTDFTPISVSPIDAQLDSAREWSLRDIALAFGISPYMLGVASDSSTYANVESRQNEFKSYTLMPWIRRIEAVLSAQLPAGVSLKCNVDATLRADTSTRYASYAVALDKGFLTIDEVRALENRPPLRPDQLTTLEPQGTAPIINDTEGISA